MTSATTLQPTSQRSVTPRAAVPLGDRIHRLLAPLAWSSDRRIARKLLGFSATELGSALDMFRATELAETAEHRRLFLRHALDESRHAVRFKEVARRIDPTARTRAHERVHAEPQDLYRVLGVAPFLAFVHISEARALSQFRALHRHFEARAKTRASPRDTLLSELFAEIAREEKVHVAYSLHLLQGLQSAREVRTELARTRRRLAWEAWKRAGARLGSRASGLVLALTFIAVLPLFALVMRLTRGGLPKPGWHLPEGSRPSPSAPATQAHDRALAAARRLG